MSPVEERSGKNYWVADMSSEGVRPAETLSTDSAIAGLVVLVSYLCGGYASAQLKLFPQIVQL